MYQLKIRGYLQQKLELLKLNLKKLFFIVMKMNLYIKLRFIKVKQKIIGISMMLKFLILI